MEISTQVPEELNELLREDERCTSYQLDSGVRAVMLPHKYPHNRLQVHGMVSCGSVCEEDSERGLAHVVEHAVFLGTEAFTTVESLRTLAKSLGMSFSGGSNAYTSFRSTVYVLDSPAAIGANVMATGESDEWFKAYQAALGGLKEEGKEGEEGGEGGLSTLGRVLFILQQLLFFATFPGPALEKEKDVVLSEAAMHNDIDYLMQCEMTAQMHSENALAVRMPIGKVPIVKACKPDDLRRFYQRWYKPWNLTIFIVGDFNPQFGEQLLERLFSAPALQKSPGFDSGPPADALLASKLSPLSIHQTKHAEKPQFQHLKRVGHGVRCLGSSVHSNEATCMKHDYTNASNKAPLRIIQDEHFSSLAFCIFVKEEIQRYVAFTQQHFRRFVLSNLLSDIFANRMTTHLHEHMRPPFSGASVESYPAAEEGCAFMCLAVTAEARCVLEDAPAAERWDRGVQLALRECIRLAR